MNDVDFVSAISPWLGPSNGPVRAHLTLAIRQAISSGQLEQGARLPPERTLAKALHVSRPTVSGVIDDLRASGLVTSRQGSGTWVSGDDVRPQPAVPFVELLDATGCIDLAAATAPDAGSLPAMRVETSDLLVAEPANGLNPLGIWPIREAIAQRARTYIPEARAENVIVTSGAHQALALVVAALAPRGSTVLVEDLTYGGLIDIIHANGCHPIGVERDDLGPRPEVLRALIDRYKPSLTILVSSVHSPTGTISPDQRCHDLADVLVEADTCVVLDETYADLEFNISSRPLSVALGEGAIRTGSLSKALWTGLRIGWIMGPAELCTRIGRRRWQQFDLGPSIPSQLFALQAMVDLDGQLQRRRERLQERALWLSKALSQNFPDWNATRVEGGLALWAELPSDGNTVAEWAANRGVALLPGSACRADHAPTNHVRICFDRPIDVLESAIDRLAT